MQQHVVHAPSSHGQLTGYIHSTESGAGVDGPGMRFVYFMSGCQFRCQYCHNPDTWKLHAGRQMTVAFLKFAGGVTVSGGEPLMQAEFVGALFTAIKQHYGLHTALDTQGFLHADVDDAWFDQVDLVLLDIKHIDPARYQLITGQALQPTLDFAQRLKRLGKPMWLRYVLVPGLTDGAEDIARLADYAASLGSIVQRVEVLPFHQMGAAKWSELGLDYPLANTPVAATAAVDAARALFAARGLTVC